MAEFYLGGMRDAGLRSCMSCLLLSCNSMRGKVTEEKWFLSRLRRCRCRTLILLSTLLIQALCSARCRSMSMCISVMQIIIVIHLLTVGFKCS